MTSWRETASQEARDDLDGLLNVVLPLAEGKLTERGEMYPFGAGIGLDGEAALLAAGEPGLGEHPASEDVLDALYSGARGDAAAHRAVAFVADVRAGGGDAIRVELEHRDGVALTVVAPYTRTRWTKKATLGQLSVGTGRPRVWTGRSEH